MLNQNMKEVCILSNLWKKCANDQITNCAGVSSGVWCIYM